MRTLCLMPTLPECSPCEAGWAEQLQRLELRNMAAHGIPTTRGGVHAWFGLFRVGAPNLRTTRMLELLLPSMAAAYARVVSGDRGIASD